MRALDVDKGMVLTLRQSDFAVVDGWATRRDSLLFTTNAPAQLPGMTMLQWRLAFRPINSQLVCDNRSVNVA